MSRFFKRSQTEKGAKELMLKTIKALKLKGKSLYRSLIILFEKGITIRFISTNIRIHDTQKTQIIS